MPDQELGCVRYFAESPDPQANRIKHWLHDMRGVTLCAVICGADTVRVWRASGRQDLSGSSHTSHQSQHSPRTASGSDPVRSG